MIEDIELRTLFDAVPVSVRVEDFSAVRSLIDDLDIDDPERFAAYLDYNRDFVAKAAKRIRVIDANTAALLLHGYDSKEEFITTVTRSFSEKNLQAVRGGLIAIHARKRLLEFETSIARRDGTTRSVFVRWTVPPGYEETYARTLLTSTDITELRRTEELLHHAQRLEAVGKIAGGVAHDFNNLLAVIQGNAELLSDEIGSNNASIRAIEHASLRGAQLTQRLLAFSRQQSLRPQSTNVAALVQGMREMLQRSLGETVAVETWSTDELSHAMTDPGQLEHALLNLALNARDAMPGGGKLSIRCENAGLDQEGGAQESYGKAGAYVVVSVSDTGQGMSPEVQAQAFEPFFTTKEVGLGSGLGLSMVYGFAKQSGGSVMIESQEGQGTTVRVYLLAADTPPASLDGKRAAALPRGKGEVILLVEDDEDVRALGRQMLIGLGFRVIEAGDVAQARQALESAAQLDLVLTDVVLPGGASGLDLADELHKRSPEIPVIFMSGYPKEAVKSDGFLGSDRVLLAKPFRRQEIAQAIRDALG